jgi:hypothetical protein
MAPKADVNFLLRGAIALVGAGIVLLGLNVGLGGIQTLGWQGGAAPFFAVTDAPIFAMREEMCSHDLSRRLFASPAHIVLEVSRE